MKFFSLFAFLALSSVVSAHFTLDFPATRGFDEDLEPNFCGGFNVSSTRQPFPLSSAPILIDSHHLSADVAIFISFQANPTTFADFNTTSTGETYGFLQNFTTISGEGEFCFKVDIAALGVAGVGNGTLATIQVEFNGGDGVLLQCTDLILSSTYTVPANVTSACTSSLNGGGSNSTSTAAPTTATSTGSVSSPSATTTTGGASRSVVLGGAGAVVAAAVAVLL